MSNILSNQELQLLALLEDLEDKGYDPPYTESRLVQLNGPTTKTSLTTLTRLGLVTRTKKGLIYPQEAGLDRFTREQDIVYEKALSEIKVGSKSSHWMWYIFPQLKGLGSSPSSRFFSIKDKTEASEYLSHPILGKRLKEANEELLKVEDKTAKDILGTTDSLKLKSSATLFASISPTGSVFHRVLDKHFGGESDSTTLELLNTK